jgi:hypothetical protein
VRRGRAKLKHHQGRRHPRDGRAPMPTPRQLAGWGSGEAHKGPQLAPIRAHGDQPAQAPPTDSPLTFPLHTVEYSAPTATASPMAPEVRTAPTQSKHPNLIVRSARPPTIRVQTHNILSTLRLTTCKGAHVGHATRPSGHGCRPHLERVVRPRPPRDDLCRLTCHRHRQALSPHGRPRHRMVRRHRTLRAKGIPP